MALGAFLAGMVVGRSDYSLRAASDALPMRDAFAVLFFVSVGMLLDLGVAVRCAVALRRRAGDIVMIANPMVAFAVMWLDAPTVQDLAAGRRGAGADRRVLVHPLDHWPRSRPAVTIEATNAIVAASIASIVANPLLYATIEPIARWVSRQPGAVPDPRATGVNRHGRGRRKCGAQKAGRIAPC